MRRYSILLWLGLPFAVSALPEPACAPVEHDPITAADLARLVPAFARLAPDLPLGPGPGPGVRRVFHPFELEGLARRYGLQVSATEDLCFELPLAPLDRARLLDAMKASLPFAGVQIEILETSPAPAPRGRIEFRREDLGTPALADTRSPVVWRGNVLYGANQQFGIWARVIVTALVPRAVAAEPIQRGSTIAANQVRLETSKAFPGRSEVAFRMEDVVGHIAERNIAEGAAIRFTQLQRPLDVRRGDSVQVEVRSGAARLAFTGKAETGGRAGEFITLRNLRSNRIFQARIDGADRASLDLDSPLRN